MRDEGLTHAASNACRETIPEYTAYLEAFDKSMRRQGFVFSPKADCTCSPPFGRGGRGHLPECRWERLTHQGEL